MSVLIPCNDPACEGGIIYVNNAYSADPLKPEGQFCDKCNERGFLVSGEPLAAAS